MKCFIRKEMCIAVFVFSMLMCALGTTAYADGKSKCLTEAQAILENLPEFNIPEGELNSRGNFVDALVRLLKVSGSNIEEFSYNDVTAQYNSYKSVYRAKELGWISDSENFEPERPVTFDEAMKISVVALGYEEIAQFQGGYPTGYGKLADTLELNENISTAMTDDDIKILLYNILLANPVKIDYHGTGAYYSRDNITVLKKLYNTEINKGIVTATRYGSITGKTIGEELIAVNGDIYSYHKDSYGMLGIKHKIFIHDEEEIICAVPMYSEMFEMDLTDIDRHENTNLYYFNKNNREKKLSLSDDCVFIYNGTVLEKDIDNYLKASPGKLKLVANRSIGEYDTVIIEAYEYMRVYKSDWYTETISDIDDFTLTVDLAEYAEYRIYDALGSEVEPQDLADETVLRVEKSPNKEIIIFTECSGKTEGIYGWSDDNDILIGEHEYFMSEYFKNNSLKNIKLGMEYEFVYDGDVAVAALRSEGTMKYGYLADVCYTGGVWDSVSVKIFTTSNKFEVYELMDKIKFDSEGGVEAENVYNILTSSGFEPQIVRYALNSDGMLKNMDTFTQADDNGYPSDFEFDEDNSLTKLDFTKSLTTSNLVFRKSGYMLGNRYSLGSALVFVIPEDADDTNGYIVTNADIFADGGTYPSNDYGEIELYDIDENGLVGAVLFKDTNKVTSRNAYIIEKVTRTINDEGETGYNLSVYGPGGFKKYFMKEDVTVTKSEEGSETAFSMHPLLSSGDIIRFNLNPKGEISRLIVDFDARRDVWKANLNSDAVFNSDTNKYLQYNYGKVYSANGSVLSLCIQNDKDNSFSTSPSGLRFFSAMSSTNIGVYNINTGKVRFVSLSDVHGYKNYGEYAWFGIVFQRNFLTASIYFYENY